MDDRELLELAAKAAGMNKLTEWSDAIWDHDSPHYGMPALHEAGSGGACLSWNPLIDDGDALRLAACLHMMVNITPIQTHAYYKKGLADGAATDPCYKRAIVRAAAEIGRAM